MKAVFVLALLAIAGASAQYTFCQRYTAALFGSSTADNQSKLLNAVVVRAAAGYKAPNAIVNVTGLFFEATNKGYFDGTLAPKVNFITDAAQQANLVLHLTQFFGAALGCVEFAATTAGTWKAVDLKTQHAAMMINGPTMVNFQQQLALTLISFGVPSATGETSDIGYAVALMGPFGKGGKMEICSQADCAAWTDFVSFMVDADSFWVAGSADKSSTANLIKGGYVHWDLTAADNIVEADSATATTAKSGGKTSGAVGATMTYTTKFDTVGTYYFYSAKAPATKRATVVVALSGAASTAASAAIVAVAALFAFVAQRV